MSGRCNGVPLKKRRVACHDDKQEIIDIADDDSSTSSSESSLFEDGGDDDDDDDDNNNEDDLSCSVKDHSQDDSINTSPMWNTQPASVAKDKRKDKSPPLINKAASSTAPTDNNNTKKRKVSMSPASKEASKPSVEGKDDQGRLSKIALPNNNKRAKTNDSRKVETATSSSKVSKKKTLKNQKGGERKKTSLDKEMALLDLPSKRQSSLDFIFQDSDDDDDELLTFQAFGPRDTNNIKNEQPHSDNKNIPPEETATDTNSVHQICEREKESSPIGGVLCSVPLAAPRADNPVNFSTKSKANKKVNPQEQSDTQQGADDEKSRKKKTKTKKGEAQPTGSGNDMLAEASSGTCAQSTVSYAASVIIGKNSAPVGSDSTIETLSKAATLESAIGTAPPTKKKKTKAKGKTEKSSDSEKKEAGHIQMKNGEKVTSATSTKSSSTKVPTDPSSAAEEETPSIVSKSTNTNAPRGISTNAIADNSNLDSTTDSQENTKMEGTFGNATCATLEAAKSKGKEKAKVTQATTSATKPKPKKMRYDQQILHHMVRAMKPFTARSLAQELKTTEQQLHHALLGMKDKGLVFEKEFSTAKGRSKILIWANLESNSKDAVSVTFSEEEASAARQQVALLKKQENDVQQELASVTNLPCNEALASQVAAEEEEVAQLKAKLEETRARIKAAKASAPASSLQRPGVRGFQPKPKSATQLARERCPRRLKMRINAMRQEWKTRKEKCTDFIENLADAMEKRPKEIYSLLDIETDEMVGVKMPAKYQIDP